MSLGRIEIAVAVELGSCEGPVRVTVGRVDRNGLYGQFERFTTGGLLIVAPITFVFDKISGRQFSIGRGEAGIARNSLAQQGPARQNTVLASTLLKEPGFQEQVVGFIFD